MINKLSFSLLIVISLCSVVPSRALAQQDQRNETVQTLPAPQTRVSPDEARVQIDAASLRNFDTALTSISQQSKTTIIAEGIPLQASLTDAQTALLRDTLPAKRPKPATEALAKIASAFDYDVQRLDKRTFLLRKRYTDPEDLPCVTYGEIVHALQAIDQIVAPYGSGLPSDITNFEVQFADSLSPEQLQAARDGIPLRDLTPDQRKAALAIAAYVMFDYRTECGHEELKELLLLKDRRTQFTWINLGVTAFGYQGPFGPGGITWDVPLTSGFTTQTGRGMILRQKEDIASALLAKDPMIATATDRRLAMGMLANRLPSTKTVAEAVRGRGITEANSPPLHIAVDERIADKPICLFGGENISQGRLIRALAALYGLYLLVPKENDFTITLPEPHSTQQASEIAGEVQRIFPLPLSRALLGQTDLLAAALEKTAPPPRPYLATMPEATREFHEDFERKVRRDTASMAALDTYYYPAVRRLLLLAQPSVPNAQSPPVPVADLPPEVMRLIAIARLTGLPLRYMRELSHDNPPLNLDEPDAIYIRVVRVNRTVYVSFGTGEHDPEGNFVAKLHYAARPALSKTPNASPGVPDKP